MAKIELTSEQIAFFSAFAQCDENHLQLITREAEVIEAPKGMKIIELGDTSEFGYFLLSGTLILKAADGGVRTIESGSDSAKNQIAQLVPRRYQVISASPVVYFKVSNQLLELIRNLYRDRDVGGIETGLSKAIMKTAINMDKQSDQSLLQGCIETTLSFGK